MSVRAWAPLAPPNNGTNVRTTLELREDLEQPNIDGVIKGVAFLGIVVDADCDWTVDIEEELAELRLPLLNIRAKRLGRVGTSHEL